MKRILNSALYVNYNALSIVPSMLWSLYQHCAVHKLMLAVLTPALSDPFAPCGKIRFVKPA